MARLTFAVLLPVALLIVLGCGGGDDTKKDESKQTEKSPAKDEKPRQEFKAVSLGGMSPKKDKGDGGGKEDYSTEDVRRALNPLQVMVGAWKGTLQRKADFETLSWRWDFSDRKQPALSFESEKGLVVKSGKLTYFPDDEAFQLVAIDADDRERTLDGEFLVEPHKVAGDDNKLHMNYKLVLSEATPPEGEKAWQVTLNQQDNNRQLVELEERRGTNFVRFETMGVQREGTSFARSFDDYGDRTCIVSQGLGTSTVSFEGQTYYVCCSGCEAAFNDDPEYWIAKALERAKESD